MIIFRDIITSKKWIPKSNSKAMPKIRDGQLKDMEFFERRVLSFRQQKWPHAQKLGFPSVEQFAYAGFFFDPSDDSPDSTECYLCHKALDGWECTDHPWNAHKKHGKMKIYMSTPEFLLIIRDYGHLIIDNVLYDEKTGRAEKLSSSLLQKKNKPGPNNHQFLHFLIPCPLTQLHEKICRLLTFSLWKNSSSSHKACPETLSEAGFYFFPRSESPDLCICFQCGTALDDWGPTDDPWSEHLKRNSSCLHLLGKSQPPFEYHRLFNFENSVSNIEKKNEPLQKVELLSSADENNLSCDHYEPVSTGTAKVQNIKKINKSIKSRSNEKGIKSSSDKIETIPPQESGSPSIITSPVDNIIVTSMANSVISFSPPVQEQLSKSPALMPYKERSKDASQAIENVKVDSSSVIQGNELKSDDAVKNKSATLQMTRKRKNEVNRDNFSDAMDQDHHMRPAAPHFSKNEHLSKNTTDTAQKNEKIKGRLASGNSTKKYMDHLGSDMNTSSQNEKLIKTRNMLKRESTMIFESQIQRASIGNDAASTEKFVPRNVTSKLKESSSAKIGKSKTQKNAVLKPIESLKDSFSDQLNESVYATPTSSKIKTSEEDKENQVNVANFNKRARSSFSSSLLSAQLSAFHQTEETCGSEDITVKTETIATSIEMIEQLKLFQSFNVQQYHEWLGTKYLEFMDRKMKKKMQDLASVWFQMVTAPKLSNASSNSAATR